RRSLGPRLASYNSRELPGKTPPPPQNRFLTPRIRPRERARHERRRSSLLGRPRRRRREGRRGRRRQRRRRRRPGGGGGVGRGRGERRGAALAAAGPPGEVRVGAPRRRVGLLPPRLRRHGRQRPRRLEAVRALRGVQVRCRDRGARLHLHDAAAGAARRTAHRRPGPAGQGRRTRRLRRRSGDGVPADVGGVGGDPDNEQDEGRRGQRVHRLVGGVHQHGLLRLPLPRPLRPRLRLQARQADLHLI
uniref:Uncharacterized protein n=1 Tax=Oryza glumipatula TaxID=40148 RepID=A0A0D9ZXS9_9ORYZ